MHPRISQALRLSARWMLIGPAGAAGVLLLAGGSASAATTGSFSNGVLTVFGDAGANTITMPLARSSSTAAR